MSLDFFKDLPLEEKIEFAESLEEEEARILMDYWPAWTLPHQEWPEGDWRVWVLRAGRASGKTFCGAKWTHEIARQGHTGGEIGIIGRTHTEVRQVCVEGPSGILATAPSDFKPEWSPGNKILTWPNGVRAKVLSADKPESIRGSQFFWAWCDEMCFWADPKKTWFESLFPAMRVPIGTNAVPRILITTSPVFLPFLQELETAKQSRLTTFSTYQNIYLTKETKQGYVDQYSGNPEAERQELLGEYVDFSSSTLWIQSTIEKYRILQEDYEKLEKEKKIVKVIIGVDPAGSDGEKSDETGIIVASMDENEEIYILEDRSGKYPPEGWAQIVSDLYKDYDANFVVAEKNYGGDMVTSNLRSKNANLPVKAVTAKKGKRLRAEPISTLYVRGKVHHVGKFKALEKEQTEWVPGAPSPNRLDALVYAVKYLFDEGSKSANSIYLMESNQRFIKQRRR